MDFLFSGSLVSGTSMLALALLCSIISLAALFLNRGQRETILDRFGIQRRRGSAAATPPRSLSPVKSEKGIASSSKAPDYVLAFPPSRRDTLAELARNNVVLKKVMSTENELSTETLRDQALPMVQSYLARDGTVKYTPTGFSTDEIAALGDFPRYDLLSGVPLPETYEEFRPDTALARPYRPFRWAYHQTMSFNKMESNWWLEIDKTYVDIIATRRGLYEKHGAMVLDYLPGSELACKELMEMALQFYCARFPQHFSISADKQTFHNRLLNTTTELKAMHPLVVLLNNVPEDFAIVLRNEKDGHYYFRAGLICSSLGWNVGTKIGLKLADIHQPIPDYKEKMSFSMDRYFSKMPTSTPIQRGSWGLEVGTPLFMPPGDPHEKLRESQQPDLQIEQCHLRVDWQTLRRLPLSGGIVFNFTALFTPVTEFRDEPYVPSLVAKVLKEGKRSLMEYKGTWHVEHVCIPAFERWEQEQKDKGMMEREWEVGTLHEYPYFPGWEEKWHRQQGY